MRLTKMIINPNKVLIGFVVKGKPSEFGQIGSNNEPIETPSTLAHLWNMKFNNSQALFSNGTITEKGRFHINQLPMVMSMPDGQMVPVENTIELTSRYVRDNENIGFGVRFGNGDENKYKYSDIIKLSELFRPVNFVIKVNTSGKMFIAGKTGSPLSSLPMVVIEGTSDAKKTRSAAKPAVPVTGGGLVNDVDILDVFEFVDSLNGFIINFEGTKYEATSDKVESAPDAFKPLGIGEVGSPHLDFNETKFNASCKFKKPGVIEVTSSAPSTTPTFAGTAHSQLVYTYIYRSKNIFYNGEHHLSKIGLIIPASAEHDLFEKFSRSMAIMEVTDEKVIDVVNRLINWKDSKIFEVDTSKLALISPQKYANYILSHADIAKYTLDMARAKIGMKYVRGAVKELANAGFVAAPKGRSIAPQFAMKSEAELSALVDAGIDVFTGALNLRGTEKPSGKAGESTPVAEVSYIINGFDPKNFTYDKIVKSPEKNRPEINNLVAKVNGVEDFTERARLLQQITVELEKREYAAKRALWLHKTSMWLKAGKRGVHHDDAASWTVNTGKRTKATCYDCIDPAAKDLQLLVLNTDIAR